MTPAGFCWTCWEPPAGPETPFHDALLMPDVLRMVVLALVLVGSVMIIKAMVVADTFPQRTRFGCLLLFTILVATIEIEHLGDTANWRLGFVLIALIWQTFSVWSFLCDCHPSNTPTNPRRRP